MENEKSLFRKEVIDNRLHRNLGAVSINAPFNFRLASYAALFIIILLIIFFSTAELSKKTVVRGYLDAETGIFTIDAEKPGIIKKVMVEEGEFVRKGQLLFIVKNINTLAINTQIQNLEQQLKHLNAEYEIKYEKFLAMQKLLKKNYISFSSFREVESQLLEFKSKVEEAIYHLNQIRKNRAQEIKAPSTGTITNIMYRNGQLVNPSRSLAQLIPENTQLIARLYTPVRDIGFLHLDQNVLLKYDAYPTQRFGFYQAIIKEINQTLLTDKKEDKPIQIGEPYYKIKATLLKPFVMVYGKKVKLNHGMTFTAVITTEKKKIWQWLFDPIYSFYGEYRV